MRNKNAAGPADRDQLRPESHRQGQPESNDQRRSESHRQGRPESNAQSRPESPVRNRPGTLDQGLPKPRGLSRAEARLETFAKFGSVLGLSRMETLMARLGNPEENLACLHVAGTNGKGSVCRFLYEALRANGFRTGLFTSPFLKRLQEQIEVDGKSIGDRELDRLTERAAEAARSMTEEGLESPTAFEVITAAAFLYFAGQQTDFVVLETGLGGKGDSTNIIPAPLISIITSISPDHTEQLGETPEEIAGEKAGIIKAGAPVVSNVAEISAARVIARTAYEKGSVLWDVSRIACIPRVSSLDGTVFDFSFSGADFREVSVSMPGPHQMENAKTAIAALEVLRKAGSVKLERDRLYRGIRRAFQPGRFEVIGKEPAVILDGAHNKEGARALRKTAERLLPGAEILILTGMLRDKDAAGVVRELLALSDSFVVTEPENPRKMTADELCAIIKRESGNTAKCSVFADAAEAAEFARKALGGYDALIAAGSLYLIGQIREIFNDESNR